MNKRQTIMEKSLTASKEYSENMIYNDFIKKLNKTFDYFYQNKNKEMDKLLHFKYLLEEFFQHYNLLEVLDPSIYDDLPF